MSQTETPIEHLKDVMRRLFGNEDEMKAMQSDPEGYFESKDLPEITAEDVDRCVTEMAPSYASSGHVANVHPAPAAYSPAEAAAYQVVQHHETIVQQYGDFTYIDESSETYVDNSIDISDLSADGDITLDLDQENVTATEGGVAAGEDIEGNVNTGEVNGIQGDGNTADDLVFGDGNTVTEDNDNTVFANNGDATNVDGDGNTLTQVDVTGSSDTNIALGDGNYQSADDIDNSVDNSVDNSINDSFDVEDSFNTDNSINDSFDVEDSFNSTDNSVDVQTDVSTDVGLI
jgi:hypothetical protein